MTDRKKSKAQAVYKKTKQGTKIKPATNPEHEIKPATNPEHEIKPATNPELRPEIPQADYRISSFDIPLESNSKLPDTETNKPQDPPKK